MRQDFEWVKNSINKCKTFWQLDCAYKMYEMFLSQYGAIPYSTELLHLYKSKKNSIKQ